uniref:Transposase n=1 Tax=Plectus sambesii TaxID=2011161 RepID=A0A914WM77_9BILA
MYNRTRDGHPTTNNSLEAYHRSLNTHFGVAHPTMWVALEKLMSYQKRIDNDYEEVISHRHPSITRPHSKWLKAEERKLACVKGYDRVANKVDYLRGIAHNLSL